MSYVGRIWTRIRRSRKHIWWPLDPTTTTTAAAYNGHFKLLLRIVLRQIIVERILLGSLVTSESYFVPNTLSRFLEKNHN